MVSFLLKCFWQCAKKLPGNARSLNLHGIYTSQQACPVFERCLLYRNVYILLKYMHILKPFYFMWKTYKLSLILWHHGGVCHRMRCRWHWWQECQSISVCFTWHPMQHKPQRHRQWSHLFVCLPSAHTVLVHFWTWDVILTGNMPSNTGTRYRKREERKLMKNVMNITTIIITGPTSTTSGTHTCSLLFAPSHWLTTFALSKVLFPFCWKIFGSTKMLQL